MSVYIQRLSDAGVPRAGNGCHYHILIYPHGARPPGLERTPETHGTNRTESAFGLPLRPLGFGSGGGGATLSREQCPGAVLHFDMDSSFPLRSFAISANITTLGVKIFRRHPDVTLREFEGMVGLYRNVGMCVCVYMCVSQCKRYTVYFLRSQSDQQLPTGTANVPPSRPLFRIAYALDDNRGKDAE